MIAKDQLSELELDLRDKKMEILGLNQELDELKATNQAMSSNAEELQNKNGDLEEEACSLFDKVNINASKSMKLSIILLYLVNMCMFI